MADLNALSVRTLEYGATPKTPIDAQVVRTAREQPNILAVAPGASAARLRAAGVRILELDVRDLRLVFEALAGEGLSTMAEALQLFGVSVERSGDGVVIRGKFKP